MRPLPLLYAATATALLADAARFRGTGDVLRPKAHRRRCAEPAKHSGAGSLLQGRGNFADGYSRVACEVDVAPESERIYFKDHACGNVSSCRLTELPMQPRLCFDFCRTQETAHFFGLVHGRDCYCGTYFHAQSTGGQGECDRQCEGDTKEMCGGKIKSSLFEMHLCGDSVDEADIALQSGAEVAGESVATIELANATEHGLRALADAWHLGVCSKEPEGPRVCGLTATLVSMAAKLTDVSASASYKSGILESQVEELEAAKKVGAADAQNASALSAVETLTASVRDYAGKVKGEVTVANNTITALAGPMRDGTRPLETWSSNYASMAPYSDPADPSWSGVCGLVPLKGKVFAAMAVDQQPLCAARCMDLGVSGGCVAFNYQEKDGLASCQLLSGDGVVAPKESLLSKVPIFEVSKTKRDELGINSMGCYASHAFLAGHPKGPLNYTVIATVTA